MTKTYTVKELTEYLKVNEHTVLAWIHSGELTAIDVSPTRGGRPKWRITREAVESFEVARMPAPPPEPRRRKRQTAGCPEIY